MKVIKIVVDELPSKCGDCSLLGWTNSDFPFCTAITDENISRIEGNPVDMCYRRSDCPLCEQASITTASNWTYPSIGIAKLKTDDTTAPFDGAGSVICGGGVKPC